MAQLRLQDIDNIVIAILLVLLLVTTIWRHFFRWPTSLGLQGKQAMTGRGWHDVKDLVPPIPIDDAASMDVLIVVRRAWDPFHAAPWLVQALLGAGYNVRVASAGAIDAAVAAPYAPCAVVFYFPRHAEGQIRRLVPFMPAGTRPPALSIGDMPESHARRLLTGTAANINFKVITFSLGLRQREGDEGAPSGYFHIKSGSNNFRNAELLVAGRVLSWLRDAFKGKKQWSS
jgi:hypothetical protein